MRLSQPEVEAFLEYGSISEVIQIPGGPLVYTLEKCGEDQMNVSRLNGSIRVGMPKELCEKWSNPEQIGFQHDYAIDDFKSISILVEKDFQCLKPREHEDESQLYPNPEA